MPKWSVANLVILQLVSNLIKGLAKRVFYINSRFLISLKIFQCWTKSNISAGAVARTNAFYGAGTGSIFLDNVQCRGNELFLSNCSNNGVGVHNCVHNEDAGVRCEIGDPGTDHDKWG